MLNNNISCHTHIGHSDTSRSCDRPNIPPVTLRHQLLRNFRIYCFWVHRHKIYQYFGPHIINLDAIREISTNTFLIPSLLYSLFVIYERISEPSHKTNRVLRKYNHKLLSDLGYCVCKREHISEVFHSDAPSVRISFIPSRCD